MSAHIKIKRVISLVFFILSGLMGEVVTTPINPLNARSQLLIGNGVVQVRPIKTDS